MRVVLDCRSVFQGMGGIGRATAALARELPQALGPADTLVLLQGVRRPSVPIAEGPRVEVANVEAGMIDPIFEQLHLPALLRQLRADLVHTTCFTTPIAASQFARVATVHDVVFRRRPELVEPGLREYLDHWTGVSARQADAIVTVSDFSAQEIAACYPAATGRVETIWNGVGPEFFRIPRQAPQGPPFLLYVGSLEQKKNVPSLLRAFRRLMELDPTLPHLLLLVGTAAKGFDLERALTEAGAHRERVRILGHVEEAQLHWLYSQAEVFVYLSEYEGFGLPPLEAMAAAVPTLVSDRTSLPEVVGSAARVVNPSSPDAVARALLRLIQDPSLRSALASQGRERACGFSWETAARRLVGVYRQALGRQACRPAGGLQTCGGEPEGECSPSPCLQVLKGGAR